MCTSACEVWGCASGSALVARSLRYVMACRWVSSDISSRLCVSGSNSPRIISLALLHACRWRHWRPARCPEPPNHTTRRQKRKTNLKLDAACDAYLLFSELFIICAFFLFIDRQIPQVFEFIEGGRPESSQYYVSIPAAWQVLSAVLFRGALRNCLLPPSIPWLCGFVLLHNIRRTSLW